MSPSWGGRKGGGSPGDRPEVLCTRNSASHSKGQRISREIWAALSSLLLLMALFAELLPGVVEPSSPAADFAVV